MRCATYLGLEMATMTKLVLVPTREYPYRYMVVRDSVSIGHVYRSSRGPGESLTWTFDGHGGRWGHTGTRAQAVAALCEPFPRTTVERAWWERAGFTSNPQ